MTSKKSIRKIELKNILENYTADLQVEKYEQYR